jgi:hypothetical protein
VKIVRRAALDGLSVLAGRVARFARPAMGVAVAATLSAGTVAFMSFSGQVSIVAGQRSPRAVRAPETTNYIDREATEALQQRAAQRIPLIYTLDSSAVAEAQKSLDESLARLLGPEKASGILSAEAARWVSKQQPSTLERVARYARLVLRLAMSPEIREGDPDDLRQAKHVVESEASSLPLPPMARAVVGELASGALRPNCSFDAVATAAKRKAAVQKVRPVEKTILAGEVIVKEGEIVNQQQIEIMRELGLLRHRPSASSTAAIFLTGALAALLVWVYLMRFDQQVYNDLKRLSLFSLLLIFPVAALAIINIKGLQPQQLSLLTATASCMMVGSLLSQPLAVLTAIVQGSLVGVMGNFELGPALTTMGSALAGVCMVGHIWPPSHLLGAGMVVAGVNAALAAAAGWLSQAPLASIGKDLSFSVIQGFGAPVLAVGGISLLQRPFDVLTHMRLLELANPRHPLLRRLLTEAPGTHADSLLVATLAEAAAEQVGANGPLARVGAYYHDVGKLRRPYLFCENQAILGVENVHAQLSPSLSSLTIASHVKDGLELAQEYHLPGELREIIEQHHGTSLVSFFYQEAQSREGAEQVAEEGFRYPGPKPSTKEAAIVMLADASLGAVWALPDKTPEKVQSTVRGITQARLSDGQLSECPLTLKDVDEVEQTFVSILNNMVFHQRVEYPQQREEAAVSASGSETDRAGASEQSGGQAGSSGGASA